MRCSDSLSTPPALISLSNLCLVGKPMLPASTLIPLIFSISQLTYNLGEGHRGDALEDNVFDC